MTNMNKELYIMTMEALNLKGLAHFNQPILNTNWEMQTFFNPKYDYLQ